MVISYKKEELTDAKVRMHEIYNNHTRAIG